MTRLFPTLLVLLTLSITGQQIDILCKSIGIPNIIAGLRELLLLSVFIFAISQYGFFKEKKLSVSLLVFLFFSTAYLFVSALEQQYFLGFYYIRVYAIPIIVLVITNTILKNMSYSQLRNALKLIGISNVILIFIALFLYGYAQSFPDQRIKLFGSALLPSAWFISGGTFMRMGLPFTSPNSLGIYTALMLLLFLFTYFALGAKKEKRSWALLLVLLNMIALLGSLSRSSILVVFVSLLLLPIIPSFRRSLFFYRFVVGTIIILSIASLALFIIEFISDGFLSIWIELNLNGKDPSMQGHLSSILDAIKNFPQYYLYGYDRGTVGPKAAVVGVDYYNVENSILGTMFDMGLFGSLVFWTNYALLLTATYINRFQILLLIPFFLFIQILPLVFEQETMSLFLFIYVFVGHLGRVGFFDELSKLNKKKNLTANMNQTIEPHGSVI